jgi:hypothetical protein
VIIKQNIVDKIFGNNSSGFKITGDWTIQSKELKNYFSQLTDDDLYFEEGREEDLIRRIGNKLGKKREEVIGILKQIQPEDF